MIIAGKNIDGFFEAVWQVTQRFCDWITSSTNPLFRTGLLSQFSSLIELGCGISGLPALVLAPKVARYLATDQEYVLKSFRENVAQNQESASRPAKSKTTKQMRNPPISKTNDIDVVALDWELDDISDLSRLLGTDVSEPDFLIACDCIFNQPLITPFIDTMISICKARQSKTNVRPTVCLIAQQLRSPEVFELWLEQKLLHFRVWKLRNDSLNRAFDDVSGFAIHLAILR